MEGNKLEVIIKEVVDYLLPELTPAETSLYFYLLRNSVLENGTCEVRVGKRTMATGYGKGSRGRKTNFAHMTELVGALTKKGCIRVLDTNREGTLYIVNLPKDIPLVAQKLTRSSTERSQEDYFNDLTKRNELFERDNWICQYCGEKVTLKNVTLDHYLPQCDGGTHSKENLKTCCLVCNGIKSGKTYEQSAASLLKSIQSRRAQSYQGVL